MTAKKRETSPVKRVLRMMISFTGWMLLLIGNLFQFPRPVGLQEILEGIEPGFLGRGRADLRITLVIADDLRLRIFAFGGFEHDDGTGDGEDGMGRRAGGTRILIPPFDGELGAGGVDGITALRSLGQGIE